MLIFVCLFLLATYQRFDGIILPEHITELKYNFSAMWRFNKPDYCSGVKLSSYYYNTRDLKLYNHKELRKSSLSMHLQRMYNILIGTESMDDPMYCVEVVCAVYFSLNKYYLCYEALYGLCCYEWKFDNTTEVNNSHLNKYLYKSLVLLMCIEKCIIKYSSMD